MWFIQVDQHIKKETYADWTVFEHISFVAVIHNLFVVDDLFHIRSVVIETHVAHKKYFSVSNVPRELTINCKRLYEQRNEADFPTITHPPDTLESLLSNFQRNMLKHFRFDR